MDRKTISQHLASSGAHESARHFIDLLLSVPHDEGSSSQLVISRAKNRTTVDFRVLCTLPDTQNAPGLTHPAAVEVLGVALERAPDGSAYRVHRIDANGYPVERPLDRRYFDSHPVFGNITPETLDGQHMVRVPRFWVRGEILDRGPFAGSPAWFISDRHRPGFRVHGGFISQKFPDGAPYFFIGAYQASMDGDTLASVPGVLPATRMTLDQFVDAAARRNSEGKTGWGIWTAQQAAAIDWLCLIEHASFDCQTAIGQGRVNAADVAAVDAPDVAQATYRGIAGLWGNVWQWVDGLKIVDGSIHLADPTDPGEWIDTGVRPPRGGWHPTSFVDPDRVGDLFIANTLAADESEAITTNVHYYDTDKGEYLPCRGGHWGYAGNAGVFALSLIDPRSYALPHIGSRPAFVL